MKLVRLLRQDRWNPPNTYPQLIWPFSVVSVAPVIGDEASTYIKLTDGLDLYVSEPVEEVQRKLEEAIGDVGVVS